MHTTNVTTPIQAVCPAAAKAYRLLHVQKQQKKGLNNTADTHTMGMRTHTHAHTTIHMTNVTTPIQAVSSCSQDIQTPT